MHPLDAENRGLKTGDWVSGQVRPPKENEKYYGLLRVEAVNGVDPDLARQRKDYGELTTIYPNQHYTDFGGGAGNQFKHIFLGETRILTKKARIAPDRQHWYYTPITWARPRSSPTRTGS